MESLNEGWVWYSLRIESTKGLNFECITISRVNSIRITRTYSLILIRDVG